MLLLILEISDSSTGIYIKYAIQGSYLEWRLLSVTLVTSDPWMLKIEIYEVGKSLVRTFEVK